MAEHKWLWPNNSTKQPVVISPYGWRTHPVTGKKAFHYGTDFSKNSFDDGYNHSITDGVVEKVGVVKYWEGGGNGVWIRNYDGSLTKYFHGAVGGIVVKRGQKVVAGQRVSKLGMTGTANVVHCHLEHSPNGEPNGQVDPVKYLTPKISASTSGGGSTPFDPKEIEVIAYHREDKTARNGGRTVKPGTGFYLNTVQGLATDKASNIVGGIGQYSLTTHVYATGTPGDVLSLRLLFQNTKLKPTDKGYNSWHYVVRGTVDKDGQLLWGEEFKHGVAAGIAVYARLDAPATNKGDVRVTAFDSDTFLFKA